MDKQEEKILKDIEKNGCHIVHVLGDEDYPNFTYSIGIEKCTGKPDLLVTGLEKDASFFLINEYNFRIKDGEVFEADQLYADFLDGFDITFKPVEPKHYKHYLEGAQWYYKGDDFKAFHFIWPDMDGVLPWEKKASKDYRALMPRLYAS